MSLLALGFFGTGLALLAYVFYQSRFAVHLSIAAYSILIYQCWVLGAYNIIVLYVVGLLWYLFVMYKIGSQMNDADLKNPSNETKKEK